MAAASTIIAVSSVVAAAAAAGGAAYQIKSSQDAKKEAKKESEKRENEAKAQQDQFNAQVQKDEALRTRNAARDRQKALSQGGTSRRDTILTSPLGAPGEAQTAGKTLLGQ